MNTFHEFIESKKAELESVGYSPEQIQWFVKQYERIADSQLTLDLEAKP